MMKKLVFFGSLFSLLPAVFAPSVSAATTSSEITQYTNDTLSIITVIASAAAVFFLIKGGYLYIASTGNPEVITEAKKTIKNAIIGLILVLGASLLISLFKGALNSSSAAGSNPAITISQIEPAKPTGGLTQVLIDAVSGFMQNIVESATRPIVDGIIGYLTTTPSLLGNKVVFNFWLVILGITDSLFAVIVALLGLHFMSASTFGYDEMELSKLLPKIGLAFLGANVSLFLADYVVFSCNVLVKAVIAATGGLSNAWVVNAINLPALSAGTTPLITLIFLILFLIIAIVLLFMYIGRLIVISLGAVLSPLIFLLSIIPKLSDFAEIAAKSYFVTVFMVFVHVVLIQLASSFLSLPSGSANSLVSIAVAIGLFLTLLKAPQIMMQMVFYNSANHVMRKIGHEITNVISTDNSAAASRQTSINTAFKAPGKAVAP